MTTPVHVHEYQLRTGVPLNAASQRRAFPGALLRVGGGYGCVHPWPEFGDAPLAEQLERLADGVTTPITEMALRCAAADGAAREKGVSLFADVTIPRSHYSWSFAEPTPPQMERVIQEGWPAIKAKGFANYQQTIRFLEECARLAGGRDQRFRIDFNGCLTAADFHGFLEATPEPIRRQMDFVEDPTPYDAGLWQQSRERWGVPLALDKGWQQGTDGFDWVVVKPARRDWRLVAARHPNTPLVMTSAMDHALGQTFAAYEAAVAQRALGQRVGLCGLSTQHLFAPDPFFERVRVRGGLMTPDTAGGGLGFGDLLERLPWRRLR